MVRGEEGARGGPDREVGRKKSPGGEGILSGRRECEAGFNPHPLTTADVEGLADEGYIFVFTSHHPEHALAIADRVVMMQRGAIIRDGSPLATVTPEKLAELYDLPARLFGNETRLGCGMPLLRQRAIECDV
jgi:hypothetical protein